MHLASTQLMWCAIKKAGTGTDAALKMFQKRKETGEMAG